MTEEPEALDDADEGAMGPVPVDRLRRAFEALEREQAARGEQAGEAEGAAGAGSPSEEGGGAARYRMPELPEGGSLEGVCEALLLVADRPLALKDFTELLECDWVPVRRALRALRERYRERGGGIEIIEVAGGWRLVTRPLYAEQVERLRTVEREQRMSQAQIETLAIVAYRQPITRAEIDAIRGAESSGVLRALIDKGLVRVTGRADQLGRPFLYGTTGLFLERFGLKNLKALPRIRRGAAKS